LRWPRSGTPKPRSTPGQTATALGADYGTKWPKAAANITYDLDLLFNPDNIWSGR
jgi:hypothetical protein